MSEHPGHREGLRERLLARVKRGFHITDTDVADLLREAVEALQRVEPERDEWKEVAEFKQAEAMKYHNLYAALEGALTARAEECRALADKTRSEDVIGAAVYRRIAKELDVLRLAVSAAGGSAPPQEAEHYDTGNPQHCHSCAISALIVAEATRTALEAEKATAEEGGSGLVSKFIGYLPEQAGTRYAVPPPLRKRFLPPIRRRVERKRVTIAAGIFCSNGIVIGADTEHTGAIKIPGPKVWGMGLPDSQLRVGISGAGDSALLRSVGERMTRLVGEVGDAPSAIDKTEEMLAKLHARHVYSHPGARDGSYGLQLLLGLRDESSFFLYETSASVLSRVDSYACIGSGADLGSYLCETWLGGNTPSIAVAIPVMVYLLQQVKKYSLMCGGDSHVLMMGFNGHVAYLTADETHYIERQFKPNDPSSVVLLAAEEYVAKRLKRPEWPIQDVVLPPPPPRVEVAPDTKKQPARKGSRTRRELG